VHWIPAADQICRHAERARIFVGVMRTRVPRICCECEDHASARRSSRVHRQPVAACSNMRRVFAQVAEYLCPRLFLVDAAARRKKTDDDDDATSTSAAAPPQTFEAAAAAARELKGASVALRLKLYGLYKQATVGDAPDAEPSGSLLDPAASHKYRSWASLRGTEPALARQRYVRAVASAGGFGDEGVGEGEEEDDDDDEAALLDGQSLEELDSALDGFAGAVMSAHAVSDEDVLAQARHDLERPLHGFARQGDVRSVRYLLGKPDTDVDARDDDLHTALHWACDGGHVEVAQALLDSGADVGAQNCDGSTPLHMAAACEHIDVARLLLASGASASATDEDGSTARDLAPSGAAADAMGL
jgi:acyl-CoA-binding protein